MWPWKKNAKSEVAKQKSRTETGQFVAQVSPPQAAVVAKQATQGVEQEAKLFGSLAQGMTAIDEMLERRQAKLEAMAGSATDDEMGSLSVIGEIANSPIAVALVNVLGPQLPGLVEKYLGVPVPPSGSHPPEQTNGVIPPGEHQEAAPQDDIVTWINRAADAPQVAVNASMPIFKSELEKRGIDPIKFKEALAKVNKAMK